MQQPQSTIKSNLTTKSPSIDNHQLQERGRLPTSQSQIQQQQRDSSTGPNKKAATAHVVCKFYKQGSCQAGDGCQFSHELAVPGSKPICTWYASGNCKFGHKCALAHVLPGQPLSYDRKNKRASQAAQREAQGLGQNDPSSPQLQHQPNPTSPRLQNAVRTPVSGIGRSLKNSNEVVGNGITNGITNTPLPPIIKINPISFPPQTITPPTIVEAFATTTATTFEIARETQPPPPKIATSYAYPNGSANPNPIPTPNLNSNPSGLSQTLNPQFAAKGASSVAAHVLLGQTGRRLSNNNQATQRALSPPRMTPRKTTGYTAAELLEASPSGSGSSLPLALPASLPKNNSMGQQHHGIFGTSPFSGSRSLFMPSSYDSTEGDAFSRSPTGPRGLEEMRRSNSNTGWDRPAMLGFNPDESALADEESDDEYDEGFLPSSLNDLLTPEEQRRRGSRISGFDPFQNHSVPADLMLSNGRPSMKIPGGSSLLSPPQPQSRSLLSNTSFPINSPPWQTSNDFLSSSPRLQPQLPPPPRPLYSQSYDPSSTSRFQPQIPSAFNPLLPSTTTTSTTTTTTTTQNSNSFLSNYFSPSLPPPLSSEYSNNPNLNLNNNNSNYLTPSNGLLTSPTLGTSLPGGLAAGLSHLHLIPASYTGDTPPLVSFLGPPPPSTTSNTTTNGNSLGTSPAGVGGVRGIGAWGNTTSNPSSSWGSSNGLVAGGKSRGIGNSNGVGGSYNTSSPLHQASSTTTTATATALSGNGNFNLSDEGGDNDDEIQFDMDT